ncbi:TlpA disulfide reductase family protein [Bdellovibrio sp. ArHS]|uniref:TlpA family protein disulfide reductase n=1 Tax=Bdellovibrio sp. ArHS TaxID=1569284 RepID=UPI000A4B5393|nr:TlpA disulfide reductase family protein [Bdellovibrio sp. ArHS]
MRLRLLLIFLFLPVLSFAAPTAGFDVDFKQISAVPLTPAKGIPFANLKGKVVLVDFWASWCTPCKDALPHYNRLYNTYKNKGLVVIAVNEDDDMKERDAFLKTQSFDFYIYQDKDRKMLGEFKVQALPTLFIFDKNLKPVTFYRGFGPDKTALLEKTLQDLLK